MVLGRLMIQQQKLQCYASVHIKETRCPHVGSYMLALLAIEKSSLRYLSVLNQQHKPCYSTQMRYLFSIFVIRLLNSYEVIRFGRVCFKHPFFSIRRVDL